MNLYEVPVTKDSTTLTHYIYVQAESGDDAKILVSEYVLELKEHLGNWVANIDMMTQVYENPFIVWTD